MPLTHCRRPCDEASLHDNRVFRDVAKSDVLCNGATFYTYTRVCVFSESVLTRVKIQK